MNYISILGDSISTYTGYIPKGYSVYYDEDNIKINEMTTVYDTWWAKVNQFMNAYLCVNNSYSGSMVSGNAFPSASSNERTSCLHNEGHIPDYILVYIGFNDFGNGIGIVNNSMAKSEKTFYESYMDMLHKIRRNYPSSKVICGTLMKGYVRDKTDWRFPDKFAGISIDEYNAAIKIATRTAGVKLADLASLDYRYEILDGSHPTKNGHATIANAWIDCLRTINF